MNTSMVKKISSAPKFPKPPKLKPKKKVAQKKLKTTPKVKSVDVFRIAFGSDAGGDAPPNSNEEFLAYIKKLSRAELSRLERKIERIRKTVMATEKDRKARDRLCGDLSCAIVERRQRATVAKTALKARIKRKVKNLPITDIEVSPSGAVLKICVAGKWVATKTFIKRYLFAEMEKVAQLVRQGLLIPDSRRHGPCAFIKGCLSLVLARSV